MSSSVKNDQSAKYTKVSESMLGHFLSALGQESGETPMTYLTQLCSNGTKLEELLACNTSPGLLFPNWKIPLSLSLSLFVHSRSEAIQDGDSQKSDKTGFWLYQPFIHRETLPQRFFSFFFPFSFFFLLNQSYDAPFPHPL